MTSQAYDWIAGGGEMGELIRGMDWSSTALGREQPWGRQILLVALTGWGQEDDKRRTREAGFDAHIVKPLDLAALEELLATDRRG